MQRVTLAPARPPLRHIHIHGIFVKHSYHQASDNQTVVTLDITVALEEKLHSVVVLKVRIDLVLVMYLHGLTLKPCYPVIANSALQYCLEKVAVVAYHLGVATVGRVTVGGEMGMTKEKESKINVRFYMLM